MALRLCHIGALPIAMRDSCMARPSQPYCHRALIDADRACGSDVRRQPVVDKYRRDHNLPARLCECRNSIGDDDHAGARDGQNSLAERMKRLIVMGLALCLSAYAAAAEQT